MDCYTPGGIHNVKFIIWYEDGVVSQEEWELMVLIRSLTNIKLRHIDDIKEEIDFLTEEVLIIPC